MTRAGWVDGERGTRARRAGRLAVLAGLAALACSLPSAPAQARTEAEVAAILADAQALYVRARAEAVLMCVDPNERGLFVSPAFFEGVDTPALSEAVFLTGDEAFEREYDRIAGLGQGEAWGPLPAPPKVRRVHDGERGGLDAGSCRACHFSGGTDGAGTLTQVGLFRGDGWHLSSATVRDAPHIMGAGYLAGLAAEITANLRDQVARLQASAEFSDAPIESTLRSHGLTFGRVVVSPDGVADLSGVEGVDPDLQVRPFGWKGRHAGLVALADEALQVHLGLQTTSRVQTFEGADDPAAWLGAGPFWDPDDDGAGYEGSNGQAMLLGAYMTQLGTPIFRPAADPRMALIQARGRALFDDIGCAACHTPELRLRDTQTTLHGLGEPAFSYGFDLAEVGQAPRPLRIDPGEGADGQIPGGVPVFAFTDLKRHDLGPALAEPGPEAPPDGATPVPGAVWVTRPLWGLADTAPYLHDGRAPTVHDAIEWHGGEADDSRAAYRALAPEDQGALRVFLMSLTRRASLVVE